MRLLGYPFFVLLLLALDAHSFVLDVFDQASIKNASSKVAYGLMKYYTGNQTGNEAIIGLLPSPYYWWEAGAVWGGMLEYWHYTNDSSYNNVTSQALRSQFSLTNDFMPPAENSQLGNDDQGFWALAAMSAVEYAFPDPPQPPSWLEVAQNVFNDFVSRWNTATCGGGLKWQIFEGHLGFDYKNAIANGAFFQLAARLARHTGNETYQDWAEKTFNWSRTIGLVDGRYNVFDGTDDNLNCSEVNHIQYTYNVGMYLYGSAIMYNYTNASDIWTVRTTGLLDATATFLSPFPNATNIMFEAECEEALACNPDQQSFKAYLARWLAASTKVAPYTKAVVAELLRVSAGGAALSCSGGADNVTCGSKWYIGGWDGTYGVGQQLAAMEVIQGLLLNSTVAPITLPNVHLNTTAPATTTVVVPTVTASSRPLFDHPNTGVAVRHPDAGWIIIPLLGFFSVALLMARC